MLKSCGFGCDRSVRFDRWDRLDGYAETSSRATLTAMGTKKPTQFTFFFFRDFRVLRGE
jgi:hypothetical protein